MGQRPYETFIFIVKDFTPEDIMHKELLEESASNFQFSPDEIPKVETIRNWISSFFVI